ncbi:MAG: hypothetical protein ABW186_07595, partial [Rhodanobacteraceae bacterium]
MHSPASVRALAALFTLAIAGCATVSQGPATTTGQKPLPPEQTGSYVTSPGREPALVADLRAAPPPLQPEVVDGKN